MQLLFVEKEQSVRHSKTLHCVFISKLYNQEIKNKEVACLRMLSNIRNLFFWLFPVLCLQLTVQWKVLRTKWCICIHSSRWFPECFTSASASSLIEKLLTTIPFFFFGIFTWCLWWAYFLWWSNLRSSFGGRWFRTEEVWKTQVSWPCVIRQSDQTIYSQPFTVI